MNQTANTDLDRLTNYNDPLNKDQVKNLLTELVQMGARLNKLIADCKVLLEDKAIAEEPSSIPTVQDTLHEVHQLGNSSAKAFNELFNTTWER